MIADKVLPSFYVVELTGEAASLEFLLGTKHHLSKITIHSADFGDDVSACTAVQDVVDFLKLVNPKVREGIDEAQFNPEFFPSQPEIETTLQMEQEELLRDKEDRVAVTCRFDEWGDFVVMKRMIEGDHLTLNAKVAAHPQRYLLEKTLEKQEHLASLYGFHNVAAPVSIH